MHLDPSDLIGQRDITNDLGLMDEQKQQHLRSMAAEGDRCKRGASSR